MARVNERSSFVVGLLSPTSWQMIVPTLKRSARSSARRWSQLSHVHGLREPHSDRDAGM